VLVLVAGCADEASWPARSGTVARRDGTPVAGALLRVAGQTVTAGADGSFTLDGVAPGATMAQVEVAGERTYAVPVWLGDTVDVIVPTAPRSGVVDVFIGGDTVFGRRFEDGDSDGIPGDGLIDPLDVTPGVKRALSLVKPLYDQADVVIVNLETAVTDRGSIHARKPFTLRSEPAILEAIVGEGIDAVTLGNNHVYDFTEEGMSRMIELVDEAGLGRTGAGRDFDEAKEPLIIEKNGVKMAFISATTIDGRPEKVTAPDGSIELTPDQPPYYTAERPEENGGQIKGGALGLSIANVEEALREARDEQSDVEILVIHGGTEYVDYANPFVGMVARHAIDLGVDLVVCHHPHVIQPVEIYKGVPILYSIGNLVFDGDFVETMPGLIVEARFSSAGLDEAAVRVVWLEDYVPRPLVGPDAVQILKRLQAISASAGTAVDIAPDGSTARLTGMPGTRLTDSIDVAAPLIAGRSAPIPIDTPRYVLGAEGATVDFGRNLLVNSSFQDNSADDNLKPVMGWDFVGRGKLVQDGALRIERSKASAVPSTVRSTGRVPVVPGEHLTLTGRWRGSNEAGTALAAVALYLDRDRDAEPLGTYETRLDARWEWTPFTVSLRVPPGVHYAQVELAHLPPATGDGAVEFDDVALVRWSGAGAPPPPDANYVALQAAGETATARIRLADRPEVVLVTP
jgi:poly-gamma-glutamate capsule biosynthesis protein CapA/YwtB (metallophosphatase superfamily)